MLSKSLSPPQANLVAPSLNLSRSSPFGNMGQISSRRTYAYLIATLNASHPDYDFSHSLRPADFKRERSLRAVMNNIDTTLFNLQPRPATPSLMAGAQTPSSAASGITWGPRTWRLIDRQMRLKECSVYRYAPEDYDLFEDDDEGSIWSMNYFFFNKALKRVCYLYLRGVSVLSQSTSQGLRTPLRTSKRVADDDSDGWLTPDLGAKKRARYWLGDREGVEVAPHDDAEPDKADPVETDSALPPPKRPLVDEHDNYILSDDDYRSLRSRSKSTVRGISEDIAEAMEV